MVPLDVPTAVLLRLTETDPEIPGLREGLTEYDVSPGLLGFVVMFAAVLACIPLLRSMVSKLRGVQHRAAAEGDRPTAARGGPRGDEGDPSDDRGDPSDDGTGGVGRLAAQGEDGPQPAE